MTYRVEITKSAAKALSKLPASIRRRIGEAIATLATDPRPAKCKKLVGDDHWRIRVGDYRVLYSIEDDRLVVRVVRVAHRREVYR